jgi:hypothetical protein
VDDLSGMFTGRSSLAPEPEPPGHWWQQSADDAVDPSGPAGRGALRGRGDGPVHASLCASAMARRTGAARSSQTLTILPRLSPPPWRRSSVFLSCVGWASLRAARRWTSIQEAPTLAPPVAAESATVDAVFQRVASSRKQPGSSLTVRSVDRFPQTPRGSDGPSPRLRQGREFRCR